MLRHYKSNVIAFILFSVAAAVGFFSIQANDYSQRSPAAASDLTEADFNHATLSVSMFEFQNSKPKLGRSYFDAVFSENTQYKVPYPFNLLLARLSDYTGQKINSPDTSGIKVVIFPMGRSLQRDAAVIGTPANQAFSFDPFFRFPRVVVAVDEEPTYPNSLLLNLKNKLYIGFNERAEILEAISYNEDEGRYEYQVITDYAAGKVPKVSYANRSLCLSCHQNQTPIFSRGPWSESNFNTQVADKLRTTLDATFHQPACVNGQNQAYCYKGQEAFYFGAPLKIVQDISQKFDTSTDQGNLIHAYQKMWKELCITSACKTVLLKAILTYRLTGKLGLVPSSETSEHLKEIDSSWNTKYPGGMSIPSPNVPNRDPLKDVVSNVGTTSFATVADQNKKSVQDLLAQSKIPTEFEPLLPRLPIDIWKDSGLDITNTNRMIRGLAQEFTNVDVQMIDQWLKKNKSENEVTTTLNSECEIDKDGNNIAISCSANSDESFSLNSYVKMNGVSGQGDVSDFKLNSKTLGYSSRLAQNDTNVFQGKSFPQITDLVGGYAKVSEDVGLLFLQKNGVSLRTLQGYYLAEILIDLKSKKAQLKVYSQDSMIDQVLADHQAELFKTPSFSRFAIMNSFMKASKMKLDRVQQILPVNLEMAVEGEILGSTLEQRMSGFSLMKNVCAQCHQSNTNVPPNFMGTISTPLTDFQQCRRIEACAARMIYRLKMRNCDPATKQAKKNPMPPKSFFKNNEQATAEWISQYNPKIIQYLSSLVSEAELAQDLTSHGLAEADAKAAASDILRNACPESNSVIYDQLPRCEFSQLKSVTRCQ
jgi:hypothetical protein